jgi:hypothetical protein
MLFKASHAIDTCEEKTLYKKTLVVVLGLLLFTFSFSGCDQMIMKPDHISVNIMVAVYVQYVDAHQTSIQKNTDGMTITIQITKNTQDRLVYERIMQNGVCQATGDFDLSDGQYIECTANIKDEDHQYHQALQGYAKLTWETVNASTNFGGVYNWYPKITIILNE